MISSPAPSIDNLTFPILIRADSFPGMREKELMKQAANFGQVVRSFRPSSIGALLNMTSPSIYDIQIVRDLLKNKDSVITRMKLSNKQAFGLLALFELQDNDRIAARQAFKVWQDTDLLLAGISAIGRSSRGGDKRAANLKKEHDKTIREICDKANKSLKSGEYNPAEIVRQIMEIKGLSKGYVYKILRENCPDWPYYK